MQFYSFNKDNSAFYENPLDAFQLLKVSDEKHREIKKPLVFFKNKINFQQDVKCVGKL
jgi:hypothetical protein